MKRNPNGYGTVTKLSGNRAKPYAFLAPATKVKGKVKREVIECFETEREARIFQAEWNVAHSPKFNHTLQMLYKDWSARGFQKISKSTENCYKSAWKYMEPLHNEKVRGIRTGHFQDIIDGMQEKGLSYSTMHNVKVLAGILEKYAMQYDIINKNYAEFVELPPNNTEEKEPFTEEQVKKLEEAARDNILYSRLILIMVYTGWRINEFLGLQVKDYDPKQNAFTGGLKTDYGKDRIVPVHSTIQPYVDELLQSGIEQLVTRKVEKGRAPNKYTETIPMTLKYFRTQCFNQTLDKIGIKQSDGSDFTPHSTRHTFATLGHKYGVDDLVLKKLLGHSPGKGVTEKTYIHIDIDQLREGIEKIRPTQNSENNTETPQSVQN